MRKTSQEPEKEKGHESVEVERREYPSDNERGKV